MTNFLAEIRRQHGNETFFTGLSYLLMILSENYGSIGDDFFSPVSFSCSVGKSRRFLNWVNGKTAITSQFHGPFGSDIVSAEATRSAVITLDGDLIVLTDPRNSTEIWGYSGLVYRLNEPADFSKAWNLGPKSYDYPFRFSPTDPYYEVTGKMKSDQGIITAEVHFYNPDVRYFRRFRVPFGRVIFTSFSSEQEIIPPLQEIILPIFTGEPVSSQSPDDPEVSNP